MDDKFVRENIDFIVGKMKQLDREDLTADQFSHILSLFDLTPEASRAFDYSNIAFHLVYFPTMKMLYFSEGYEKLTGFPHAELGQDNMLFFLSRIHPEDLPVCNDILTRTDKILRNSESGILKKPRLTHNYRFTRKDGSVAKFLTHIHYMYSEDGTEPRFSLILTQDITSIKSDNTISYTISWFDDSIKSYKIIAEEVFSSGLNFTARETEIIKFSAAGDSNKQIASKLNITEQTVKNFKYQMFRKADVKNMVQLIIWSREKGIM